MKPFLLVIAASLSALGALAAACSSKSGASLAPQPSSGDAAGGDGTVGTSPPPAADGGDSGAGEDAALAPPQAFVRIAHVSPDLPAIDICVAPHGTSDFQGPLVGQLAASLFGDSGAGDASLPGLEYPQVSAYLAVTPGQYDVRLVAAGATDCTARLAKSSPGGSPGDGGTAVDATTSADAGSDASVGPADAATTDAAPDASGPGTVADTTSLPTLAFNTSTTLLIAGNFSPAGSDRGLTLTMLADDAVLAGGAAVLRAINAVPSWPALDFGYSAPQDAWSPMFAGVAFAAASTQAAPGYGPVDANGYLPIAPVVGEAMSARPSGEDAAGDAASASSVEIDLGSIATIVAVGGKSGDPASAHALLVCMDNQPSGGLLSDCSIAQ